MTTAPAAPNGKNEHDMLQRFRKRTLRAFLRAYDDTTPEAGALWAVLFRRAVVDHDTALSVGRELETTQRTVGDLLNGWRPEALADCWESHTFKAAAPPSEPT